MNTVKTRLRRAKELIERTIGGVRNGDRLKGLKKTMDDTAFSQLQFTEQHRKEIRTKISRNDRRVFYWPSCNYLSKKKQAMN